MKNFRIIILYISIFFVFCNSCFAENSYSPKAIQLYNSGGMLQNQKKDSQAIVQYKEALKIQPNMSEAKHNLAHIYENLAIKNFNKGGYSEAVSYAKQSLSFKSDNQDLLSLLADSYGKMNDFKDAIPIYQKLVAQNPQDINKMHVLAQAYILSKKYSEASVIYKKILEIEPSDKIAMQNTCYVKQEVQNNQLVSNLNSIKQCPHAPSQVYALLKSEGNIPYKNVENIKYMLDLIWSDQTGKIILTSLVQNNVPINITNQGIMDANATLTHDKTSQLFEDSTMTSLGQSSNLSVNIPEIHIQNFMNPKLSTIQRLYSLHTLVHEFCHAYRFINFPQNNNSLEEEIGASMIGFDLSYRVLVGSDMTREQTQAYSKMLLKSVLSDSHKTLPVYSNFQRNMLSKGLEMPYPEIYSNINRMYDSLIVAR